MNEAIFDLCKKIANLYYDGHMTLMKFTTNWRFCFGTAECREDISAMAEGKTEDEAMINGILREIRGEPKCCH